MAIDDKPSDGQAGDIDGTADWAEALLEQQKATEGAADLAGALGAALP